MGRFLLAKWLAKHGITQADFADLVDVKRPTISQLLSGRRSAGLGLALDIGRVTGGAVPAKSWVAKKRRAA